MTICPPPPPPFTCAICGKEQMTSPWDKYPRASHPIPPLCNHCAQTWGKSIGGWGDLNRDRRMIRQISALAEVLICTAHCIQNEHVVPYGRA